MLIQVSSVALYRWRVPDERKPGRTRVTRWAMTEAEALERYPGAEKVDGSLEVRTPLGHTSDFIQKGRDES
jgi:hypothetical protein